MSMEDGETLSGRLTAKDHIDIPVQLGNLGISFQSQFEHTGDLNDISKAVLYLQKAVQLTPEGHAHLPYWLGSLGNSFRLRFDYTGDLNDISEAVSSLQKAVQLTSEDHAHLPGWLGRIGISFRLRFNHTGDLNDISEAISSLQKAVHLTPRSHADMPRWLGSLGISFRLRFDHTGDLNDISEAVASLQKAVYLTPEGHAHMSIWLGNLGNSFGSQFEHSGDLNDISEAVTCLQKAVKLTSEGHANMPVWLGNLGISFQSRFECTGDLNDISEAVSSLQRAVYLTSESHAHMPLWLGSLGNSFRLRFEYAGDLNDISEAISSLQKAVHLIPEGHAHMSVWLGSLGISFQSQFEHTKDLNDISEAVSSLQKAICLTPEGHTHMPIWLGSLGISFRSQFKHTEDLSNISKAVSSLQKAIDLTPEGHASMPCWLGNLGISFQLRFEYTRDLNDISKAVLSLKKAVYLTPEGHARVPFWLNSLGISFGARFKLTEDPTDVQQAILNFRLSATYFSGPPSIRLAGAKEWIYWSNQLSDQFQLLEAYHTVIHLISLTAGLEQTIQKRYTNLINISELSASAAAAAFHFEKHGLALEWLEQSHCLVWSQLNNLRTPLDDLRLQNPDLADEIFRVSRALENAGSRGEPSTFAVKPSMIQKMSMQDEVTAHVKLAQEWEQLLTKVRAMPHFENFLKPVSCSSLLKNIPNSGPVVVINIHKDRSDALALVSGVEKPHHIALPEFSYEKAENLCNCLKAHLLDSGLRMRGSELDINLDNARGMHHYKKTSANVIKDVLRELWLFVVKPILNGLGYSDSPSDISRIWWCVTGPLAFLPIHAAGIYSPTKSTPGMYSTLSDFAVSSYTPTVRALAERVKNPREVDKMKRGLFMISQPDTPDLCHIPGTRREVQVIEQLMKDHNFCHLHLESNAATVNQVTKNMKAYSCIHFACHAAQNTDEPLQSGFYLHDGQLNLLSIIKEQLVGVDLAFLSACQTCTGDEKLSEEAVHLAAGMLAAGYQGVIATMWSIEDRHGPKIAEAFYENLIDSEGLSSAGAAHALHFAMQQIRKTLGDSDSSLLTWVPYVHFGL